MICEASSLTSTSDRNCSLLLRGPPPAPPAAAAWPSGVSAALLPSASHHARSASAAGPSGLTVTCSRMQQNEDAGCEVMVVQGCMEALRGVLAKQRAHKKTPLAYASGDAEFCASALVVLRLKAAVTCKLSKPCCNAENFRQSCACAIVPTHLAACDCAEGAAVVVANAHTRDLHTTRQQQHSTGSIREQHQTCVSSSTHRASAGCTLQISAWACCWGTLISKPVLYS
jgi:hypothetical protein